MMQAVGAYALPFKQPDVGPDYAANLGAGYCNLRKLSIFGGSNEIQKNIISQMIMGL
jgi:alkylation response protein AidB-like acyl-CoA dehydrogenase